MTHCWSLRSGRYQFFVAIAFSAVLSSVRSATICLLAESCDFPCHFRFTTKLFIVELSIYPGPTTYLH